MTGNYWRAFLDEWRAVRAELRAIEAAEHPDVVDGYGRVWQWQPGPGDLYAHDGMALPLAAVTGGGARLPLPMLAGNPNYRGLCDICVRDWPAEAVAELRGHAETAGAE
jgi:hypothetical protein